MRGAKKKIPNDPDHVPDHVPGMIGDVDLDVQVTDGLDPDLRDAVNPPHHPEKFAFLG